MSEVDLSEFGPTEEDRHAAEMGELKSRLRYAQKELLKLEAKCNLLTAIDGLRASPPKWLTKMPAKRGHAGIANTISSDQHFGEIVDPAEVAGVNAYDRNIALLRWRKHMEKFVVLGKDYLGHITYDGAQIWWNGDTFSGNIHYELAASNEGTIMDELEFWLDPIVAGFKMVADAYGKLHISCRRGNHTRTSPKVPAKGRVRESYDYLLARLLFREFRNDDRVTFDIPVSDDGIIQQYQTRFLATHGDQFRGGSGISGILTPLSLGQHRKSRRQASIDQPYDVMILGHFHQYMTIPGVIVNGSLKGYDEYAYVSNFGFEPPRQAFWVTTPDHGPAFHVPIEPQDREAEGW